jgi:hypothetical protein
MEAKVKGKVQQNERKETKEKNVDLGLLDSTKHMTKVTNEFFFIRYGYRYYQKMFFVILGNETAWHDEALASSPCF